MTSPTCERAISDAMQYGKAILRFVSANDVGLTGGHQAGFHLPKDAWTHYTPFAPVKGRNDKHSVKVQWQDGRITDSVVTWYGEKTRNEYRLTRFGRDFPFRTFDDLGSLFVLIPKSLTEFLAYIIEFDDDVEEIQSTLGVEVTPGRGWALYLASQVEEESPDECLDRHFRAFAAGLTGFPTGAVMSQETIKALLDCIKDFNEGLADDRLIKGVEAEYRLFKLIERQICGPEICQTFRDIDGFLKLANSILNRRKSRAGRALENHVEVLLTNAGIPFDMRTNVKGVPDILIPGQDAYDDPSYPGSKQIMIGVKTTCKDRWRQVLEEAPRIPVKHILTLQPGISAKQLKEMHSRKVRLIVPKSLHKQFPKDTGVSIVSIEQFIEEARRVVQQAPQRDSH